MQHYKTLLEALEGLKKEGYTEDFNLKESCIVCHGKNLQLFHDDFEIDNTFRFDNDTDPADQSIVYAISSEKYKVKGILINSYGIYSDDTTDEMVEKLK